MTLKMHFDNDDGGGGGGVGDNASTQHQKLGPLVYGHWGYQLIFHIPIKRNYLI